MYVHINIISIDFLNNLGCFFVKCLLRLPLGLLSGLHSQDMKKRNDSYHQCLDYTDISQRGYQRNYDEICDFLKDLNLISIERDIEVPKDHVYHALFFLSEFTSIFCCLTLWMHFLLPDNLTLLVPSLSDLDLL